MYDQDMIGAIKIKDGLFIGDELASQVSLKDALAIASFILSKGFIKY